MPSSGWNRQAKAVSNEGFRMTRSKDVAPPLAMRSRDAARCLGVSERTLARLKAAGELEFVRVGTAVLYPYTALQSWLSGKAVTA